MVQIYIGAQGYSILMAGKISMNNTRIEKIYMNVTKVLGLEKQENWCIKYHYKKI